MALPANWQPAATRSASSVSPILNGILFLALLGATVTLYLLLLKDVFLIHWKSSSPEVKHLLDFLAVSAPYLVSMILLLIPNFYTRALAPGITSVAAAVFLYFEGLLFAAALLAAFFELSPSMRMPGPSARSIAVVAAFSLLCHLAVFLSSLVLMARSFRALPVFLLGAVLAGFYAQGVYNKQQSSQANYFESIEDVDKESAAALKTVESISWCAIEFASEYRPEGYPASLDLINGSPTCKRSWSLSAIPHYSVTYTPSFEASGKVIAFSVMAVAPWSSLRAPQNAESDQSGVALIQYQDPHDNRYPTQVGTISPLDTIWLNKICFRNYAADHQQLGFPRNFADVPDCANAFRQYGSSFLSDRSVKLGPYLFVYLPAKPDRMGKRTSYGLQATCLEYGTSCLHSFLLTNQGLFVTSAGRPATSQDTLLPPCPHGARTKTFCIN